MNGIISFFNDPKTLISLIAILISTITFIWVRLNQKDQNRRWDILNLASVNIKIIRPIYWNEYSREDAEHVMKWGYQPCLYAGEYYNRFKLASVLTRFDRNTKKRIEGLNPIFTVPELVEQLKKKRLEINNVLVFQVLTHNFVIQNSGKTTASDVSVKIYIVDNSSGETSTVFASPRNILLSAGQESAIRTEFSLPLTDLPGKVNFEILISFKDSNIKHHSQKILASWNKEDNNFSYAT